MTVQSAATARIGPFPTIKPATFSDDSAENRAKNLQRQSGQKYDGYLGREHFALAQLLHYTVEANPEGDKDAPERLTLAFSTADVVVTGSRLAHLADLLRDHKLAALRTLPERYGNLEPSQSWITSIAINRLDKPSSAAD